MILHIDDLDQADAYKWLYSLIVPRPIGWISTISKDGNSDNIAPFSSFNIMTSKPAIVVFKIGNKPDGTPKDTARNIIATGEFTINLANRSLAKMMHKSSENIPYSESEFTKFAIPKAKGISVDSPYVKTSPAVFECEFVQDIHIDSITLFAGKIKQAIINDTIIDNGHINYEALDIVGRLGGGYTYCNDMITPENL